MAQVIRIRSREARDKLASLLEAVRSSNARFELTLRGKVITVLGPLSDLRDDTDGLERVGSTDLKNGKRSLVQVGFGPRIVTRKGIEVAVLLPAPDAIQRIADFSPSKHLLDTLNDIANSLAELRVLDEAKKRRVDLKSRMNKAIIRQLDILRASGSDAYARFKKDFDEIDRNL